MEMTSRTPSADPATGLSPLVSIVIPCRNEAGYIGNCLDSIIASTYPPDRLEVLVVDGMSDDGTRALVESYGGRHPFIRLVDNPRRTTAYAFNEGVRRASGDLVMIMSAHATYHPDAILLSTKYSREYAADNVGGVWCVQPRTDGLMGKAIVQALSHPFGVGNAAYRTRSAGKPAWVDTAAYGCYRKSVFERVGFFNEDLTHSQDMEFNLRLQAAGGRTLLVPDIRINYYARSDGAAFLKHNFRNGLWVILPFLHSEIFPVSLRHLIPLLFVLTISFAALMAAVSSAGILPLAAIAGSYAACAIVASVHIGWRARDPRLLLAMPPTFAMLHLTYGFGSLWGVLSLLRGRRKAGAGRWAYPALKRAFDVGLAFIGLCTCLPILLVAGIAIKFESAGPVLYRSVRIGLNGLPFLILKLRTMRADADKMGGTSTADDDPRITRFGMFLRALKLDELPQLINVLRGEMSIVGPRPQVEHDVAKYSPLERAILSVRPGITDYASIRFRNEGTILKGHADPDKAYIDLIRPEKIRLALHYVHHRGFLSDLGIIWMTILSLVGREVELP